MGADFLVDNPGEKFVKIQRDLRDGLLHQLEEIDTSLSVYGKKCDEKLAALYDHLTKMSAVMRETVQAACAQVK